MKELKPCPFCGEKDISMKSVHDYGGWGGAPFYKIVCKHCFAEVDFHSGSEIDTLLKWNRRAEPSNEPLTLDELRQMDGEPVYCKNKVDPNKSGWGIVCAREKAPYVRTHSGKGSLSMLFYFIVYNVEWLAYRRRPEEAPTHD